MRIAHLSDVHLGYRAYNKITSQGLNWREADVFNAFREALNKIVKIEPDLILISGDLFHTVRPSNLIIQQTFKAFIELRKSSSAPVVIIGGNHDSPRSADTGCILDLLTNIPFVLVSHKEFEIFRLDNLDVSVSCLSHRAVQKINEYIIKPQSDAKYNILMVHGAIEGLKMGTYDPFIMKRSDVNLEEWDYAAFGHYHSFYKIADNAYYSGSTEYTSFNIWEEAGKQKGFIEYDIQTRQMTDFHTLQTQNVVDLRPLDAEGLSSFEVNKAILDSVEGLMGDSGRNIVRLVVMNFPRAMRSDLDYAMIRRIKSELLHFELQLRQPEHSKRPDGTEVTGLGKSLEDEWRDFVAACELQQGIDRKELTNAGVEYLVNIAAEENAI